MGHKGIIFIPAELGHDGLILIPAELGHEGLILMPAQLSSMGSVINDIYFLRLSSIDSSREMARLLQSLHTKQGTQYTTSPAPRTIPVSLPLVRREAPIPVVRTQCLIGTHCIRTPVTLPLRRALATPLIS